MSGQENRRSPWLYVVAGCGGCVTLVVVGLVVMGVVGARWAKQVEADLKDPEARARKVCEILGCQQIPEGYYAAMGLTIPWVVEFAILTDTPPPAGAEPDTLGESGFIYVNVISAGKDEQRLRDFFEGKTEDIDVLAEHNIDIDAEEEIGRGLLELEAFDLMYVAQRGKVRFEDGKVEGFTTVMLFECPKDDRMRFGIWFAPDPNAEAGVEELELGGTIADPAEMTRFVGHFRLCR